MSLLQFKAINIINKDIEIKGREEGLQKRKSIGYCYLTQLVYTSNGGLKVSRGQAEPMGVRTVDTKLTLRSLHRFVPHKVREIKPLSCLHHVSFVDLPMATTNVIIHGFCLWNISRQT